MKTLRRSGTSSLIVIAASVIAVSLTGGPVASEAKADDLQECYEYGIPVTGAPGRLAWWWGPDSEWAEGAQATNKTYEQKYLRSSQPESIVIPPRVCATEYVLQYKDKGKWRTKDSDQKVQGNYVYLTPDQFCGFLTWCKGTFEYRILGDGQLMGEFTATYVPAKRPDPKITLSAPKKAKQDSAFEVRARFSKAGRYDCTLHYESPAGAYPNPGSRIIEDTWNQRVQGKVVEFVVPTVSKGKSYYTIACNGRWGKFGQAGTTRVR